MFSEFNGLNKDRMAQSKLRCTLKFDHSESGQKVEQRRVDKKQVENKSMEMCGYLYRQQNPAKVLHYK